MYHLKFRKEFIWRRNIIWVTTELGKFLKAGSSIRKTVEGKLKNMGIARWAEKENPMHMTDGKWPERYALLHKSGVTQTKGGVHSKRSDQCFQMPRSWPNFLNDWPDLIYNPAPACMSHLILLHHHFQPVCISWICISWRVPWIFQCHFTLPHLCSVIPSTCYVHIHPPQIVIINQMPSWAFASAKPFQCGLHPVECVDHSPIQASTLLWSWLCSPPVTFYFSVSMPIFSTWLSCLGP